MVWHCHSISRRSINRLDDRRHPALSVLFSVPSVHRRIAAIWPGGQFSAFNRPPFCVRYMCRSGYEEKIVKKGPVRVHCMKLLLAGWLSWLRIFSCPVGAKTSVLCRDKKPTFYRANIYAWYIGRCAVSDDKSSMCSSVYVNVIINHGQTFLNPALYV